MLPTGYAPSMSTLTSPVFPSTLVTGGVYVISHFVKSKGAAAVFQYDLILGVILAIVGVWLLTTPDLIITFLQYILGAILVGVSFGEDISASMDELEGLAEAADVEVLGRLLQDRDRPDTATYIGKGKVQELAEMCANMGANTVIFNNELSGMQIRNLEDTAGVTILDRTILILDIFAARATSSVGKLQVEYAQLRYRMPRPRCGSDRGVSRSVVDLPERGDS